MNSTITKNQLKRRLEEAKGCQFVSIKYAKYNQLKKQVILILYNTLF